MTGAGCDCHIIMGDAIGLSRKPRLDRLIGNHIDAALSAWMGNFFSGKRKPGDLDPLAGIALEGQGAGKSVARQVTA